MEDNTDYDAIRKDLAYLCCRLRGLNPDYVRTGWQEPVWKSPEILAAVEVMMAVAGNKDAAERHVQLAERTRAAEHVAPGGIQLIERLAYSVISGNISQTIDAVLAMPRHAEAVIVFNDLVIPVHMDDDASTLLRRWAELDTANGRD